MTQRTIEITTTAVIINNRVTTLVKLELWPSKGCTHLNVLKVHKHIFSAMNLINITLKLITFQNETIDTSYRLPPSIVEYTSKFKESYKYPKSSCLYISHKIESAIPISVLKYGNRQQLLNIFVTLVTNGTYLTYNKFRAYTEHSIKLFTHNNP